MPQGWGFLHSTWSNPYYSPTHPGGGGVGIVIDRCIMPLDCAVVGHSGVESAHGFRLNGARTGGLNVTFKEMIPIVLVTAM